MTGPRTERSGRRRWTLLLVAALTLAACAVSTAAQASTPSHKPFGGLDRVIQSGTGIAVSGWALDPDTHSAIHVDVYLDGHGKRLTANTVRADVAKAHPGYGSHHGFQAQLPAGAGRHTLCAYAIDYGPGSANASLGCRNVTVTFSPIGALTSLTQAPGGFRVAGWALDPEISGPITVTVWADHKQVGSILAKLASKAHSGHGYAAAYVLGTGMIPPGSHTVCVHGVNAGTLGTNRTLACQSIRLNFNPRAALTGLKQVSPGYRVTGWVSDPDTAAPIQVVVKTNGRTSKALLANKAGGSHPGHNFAAVIPAVNGRYTVCAYGINVLYGSGNSAPACAVITLNFNPIGALEKLARVPGSSDVRVTGWAIDPDTTKPSPIRVSIDRHVVGTQLAAGARPDIGKRHPAFGPAHGLAARFAASAGKHSVCATAVNVLGGTGDTKLGCKIVNAVRPVVPSAPRAVTASGGFGTATVSWAAPRSDGGAPCTSYTVTSSPGGRAVTVGPTKLTATVTGLIAHRHYSFGVVARNVAGRSAAGRSPTVVTEVSPPPQTSPAPISTSRYIRNISGSSSTDLKKMRAEGAADARANPSGHGYVILLDIGGQDQADHGVVLSATTRFVSYANLVRDLDAYVDGYHSRQKPSAPVTIAFGTNNDMDVSASSGATWARSVVNPVLAHAAGYSGMRIAGANDVEPGFTGTYAQSKAWLGGYLGATHAPFVFNGSADGCAWTVTNRRCNNGWTMAGLYNLSAGAAPGRIVNLPQIYNNTMAAQWKYISLTGIATRRPRINFGGALTEYTACAQVGGCGSLSGNNAWSQMWRQLQSLPALRIRSLPYSTDLRIDR